MWKTRPGVPDLSRNGPLSKPQATAQKTGFKKSTKAHNLNSCFESVDIIRDALPSNAHMNLVAPNRKSSSGVRGWKRLRVAFVGPKKQHEPSGTQRRLSELSLDVEIISQSQAHLAWKTDVSHSLQMTNQWCKPWENHGKTHPI